MKLNLRDVNKIGHKSANTMLYGLKIGCEGF